MSITIRNGCLLNNKKDSKVLSIDLMNEELLSYLVITLLFNILFRNAVEKSLIARL